MYKLFKIFFLIITLLIIFNYNFLFAIDTCEINTSPILNPKLIFDKNSSEILRNLSQEYSIVYSKQSFDKNFYHKINSYIDLNKHSYSSLSALIILASMCFLENDETKYSEYGKKIIDFIISKYPTTIQGRAMLLLKAQIQADEGYRTEALKLLQDNYEVVLSIEKDMAYPNYLYELNFENHDPIIAEYFFLLANTHYYLSEENEAINFFNTLIKAYPNSEAASNSKRVLKAIKALNKR